MIFSKDNNRLFEITASLYPFIILFHDNEGALMRAYPGLDDAYRQPYIHSGIYGKLKSIIKADNRPQLITNSTMDIWAGFPFDYDTDCTGMVIIGPVFFADVSEKTMRELLNESSVSHEIKDIWKKHLHTLPVVAYNEFVRIVHQLFYVVTGKRFDDFNIGITSQIEVKRDLDKLAAKQQRTLFDDTMVHATYSFEKYMLSCVREGNSEKLLRHLNNGMPGNEGKLTEGDPLRQAKNMFVVATTIATRAAIEGGLNPEIAMSLSDGFIQQMEQMRDARLIFASQGGMLLEFTKRVKELNQKQRYSKVVTDCCQYIHENIYENLRLSDVASRVHLSENYVSSKFKEETGESIGSFIRRAKISEAKSLLRYTGMTLPEISTLLSYSSQSFFTTVFRQEVGQTPKQFRESAAKEENLNAGS
jgi:AraC-like DNA-binding protein